MDLLNVYFSSILLWHSKLFFCTVIASDFFSNTFLKSIVNLEFCHHLHYLLFLLFSNLSDAFIQSDFQIRKSY